VNKIDELRAKSEVLKELKEASLQLHKLHVEQEQKVKSLSDEIASEMPYVKREGLSLSSDLNGNIIFRVDRPYGQIQVIARISSRDFVDMVRELAALGAIDLSEPSEANP